MLPSLKDIEFTWHTEHYSGGHGNYLMSGIIETRPHSAYNGREEVACAYEIGFHKAHKAHQMLPHPEYLGDISTSSAYHSQALDQIKTITTTILEPAKKSIPWLQGLIPQNGNGHNDIIITKEGDWTWVSGEGTRAIKDHLKILGGRWSKKRAAWYFTKPITEKEIIKGEL